MKILLVEDDKNIREILKRELSKWDYEVENELDFKDVMSTFKTFEPDFVIMDLKLPYYNGYHWTREIRNVSEVPILFLSSADDNLNMIMAMDLGADDYVTKPFDMDLLLAKIKTILRRTGQKMQEETIKHELFTLNLRTMEIEKENMQKSLTKNELKILETLLLQRPGIVSREELMLKLWKSDEYVDDNTLTVNINRLRKKLSEIGATDVVKTKIGIGYYVE
ncbi:DNA-binding response regulator, OmpR family, contains REC and winged-helix (wHTH) domain [Peptoniphilus asaccharolyticus DSM 20463]|uniref:DNA-binding response regulator, OmpR family, contains REC and winged-helix (WHTH) domain n=1 Tax=Peptoniphilus asaccharolyticus DSM 20463 TaxID=573058 RepID=A0A1W1V3J3_PEPAS|nr:response regulator transcription factor [Peptoniphilus asaccharolyticus]MBL7576212.1 response regulator transcription factor [Peptoniphilus asaccharolyticus]SMB87850.1 DNA-binding response regulator, OmpR family, contains REC and winged-helix (wHTH) domain [Peptoniphilus asaccharolyticus DSM 20463]